MTYIKYIAQFLAQHNSSASASWGWQQQAVTIVPLGGVAVATGADVAATFFFPLFVQMLPL